MPILDDAQFELASVDLANLVQMAYQLPPDQISGPGWLADERFAIAAKLPAGASRSQVFEMLQTMLAERFKMAVHREQKVRPVYTLVVGKGPLKLKQSAGGDPSQQGCNGGRGGRHNCQNVTMEDFAAFLTRVGNAELFGKNWAGRWWTRQGSRAPSISPWISAALGRQEGAEAMRPPRTAW
jgi:uncharacterized protein (TIGR03435 family)